MNCFTFVRLEQAELSDSGGSELGEEVLNELSEFRNLTLKPGRPRQRKAPHGAFRVAEWCVLGIDLITVKCDNVCTTWILIL